MEISGRALIFMGASLPSIPPSIPSSGQDTPSPSSPFLLLPPPLPYPSVPPLSSPISLLQSPYFLPSLYFSLPSPPLSPPCICCVSVCWLSQTLQSLTHTEMSRMFSVLSHSDGQDPGDWGWDTVGLGWVTGYRISGPLVGWPGSPTLLVYV